MTQPHFYAVSFIVIAISVITYPLSFLFYGSAFRQENRATSEPASMTCMIARLRLVGQPEFQLAAT